MTLPRFVPGGAFPTANDLNQFADAITRQNKIWAAPPLYVQNGQGGLTVTFADGEFWAAVCCRNADTSYQIAEVVLNSGGLPQLMDGARQGKGWNLNPSEFLNPGQIVRVYPGFSGEYVFLAKEASPALFNLAGCPCSSESSSSSATSPGSSSSSSGNCQPDCIQLTLAGSCGTALNLPLTWDGMKWASDRPFTFGTCSTVEVQIVPTGLGGFNLVWGVSSVAAGTVQCDPFTLVFADTSLFTACGCESVTASVTERACSSSSSSSSGSPGSSSSSSSESSGSSSSQSSGSSSSSSSRRSSSSVSSGSSCGCDGETIRVVTGIACVGGNLEVTYTTICLPAGSILNCTPSSSTSPPASSSAGPSPPVPPVPPPPFGGD